MKHSVLYDLSAEGIAFILFCTMLLAIYCGYFIGSKNPKTTKDHSSLLSSFMGLLALLLAFTFGMAGSRYDNRKATVIEEANCIGTAILRADIFPDSLKNEFKKDFRTYLDARITYFNAGRDDAKIGTSLQQSNAASILLWKRATDYAKDKDHIVQSQMMLPALNSMFDIATESNVAYNSSVPESIIYLLLSYSIVISFYIGYDSSSKMKLGALYSFGFCLLTCIVIYITLDLDRPRRGLINLNAGMVLFENLKSGL